MVRWLDGCGVVTDGGDGCGVVTDGGDGCGVVTDDGMVVVMVVLFAAIKAIPQ